jgi:hypothetical protein
MEAQSNQIPKNTAIVTASTSAVAGVHICTTFRAAVANKALRVERTMLDIMTDRPVQSCVRHSKE